MARIMSIARGMAKLISGATWQDTNLVRFASVRQSKANEMQQPECFQPTRDRLQQSMSVQEEFWAGKKGWTIQPSKL